MIDNAPLLRKILGKCCLVQAFSFPCKLSETQNMQKKICLCNCHRIETERWLVDDDNAFCISVWHHDAQIHTKVLLHSFIIRSAFHTLLRKGLFSLSLFSLSWSHSKEKREREDGSESSFMGTSESVSQSQCGEKDTLILEGG